MSQIWAAVKPAPSFAKTRSHRHKLLQGGNCPRRGPPKHAHKVRVERHSSIVLFSRHWQSIIGVTCCRYGPPSSQPHPFQKTSAHTKAIIGRQLPQTWAPQARTHAQFERKGVAPPHPIQDKGMHTHVLISNELLDFTCRRFGPPSNHAHSLPKTRMHKHKLL